VFSFFSVSLSLRLSLCASFLLLCMILCMLSMICYSLCHISCMSFCVVLCTVACRCSSLWGSNGGSVCVCVCVCVVVLPISAGCFLVRRNSFKRFVSRLHYFAWNCWAVNLCCFLLVWMLVGFGVSVFRSGSCLFVAIQTQEQGGIWNKIGFSDFCFIVIVFCVVCLPKTVS
jgi:hypothetical protein